jgi:hypothetical protein
MSYHFILTTKRGSRVYSDPIEKDDAEIEAKLTKMVEAVADGGSMILESDGHVKAYPNHAIESVYWVKR